MRATRARLVTPQVQLLIQLGASAIILLAISPVFGPLIRDLQTIHYWGMGFQIFVIASGGFLFWLWLLTIYPASGVSSFSFLSPAIGVFLGWVLLGETLGAGIFGALGLVAIGLILINLRQKLGRRAAP